MKFFAEGALRKIQDKDDTPLRFCFQIPNLRLFLSLFLSVISGEDSGTPAGSRDAGTFLPEYARTSKDPQVPAAGVKPQRNRK